MLILTFFVNNKSVFKLTIKKKEIEIYLDEENKINFTIIKEDDKFKRFAINYSANIDGRWHAVYRVDNHHGYIHEQRLWITKEPIPLPEYEEMDLKEVFDIFFDRVKNGFLRFRRCYEASIKNKKVRKNGQKAYY